jgi:hypothetical protein
VEKISETMRHQTPEKNLKKEKKDNVVKNHTPHTLGKSLTLRTDKKTQSDKRIPFYWRGASFRMALSS